MNLVDSSVFVILGCFGSDLLRFGFEVMAFNSCWIGDCGFEWVVAGLNRCGLVWFRWCWAIFGGWGLFDFELVWVFGGAMLFWWLGLLWICVGWLFRWSWDVSAWVSCYVVLGCFSVWSLFESVLVGLFQWCWDISMVLGLRFWWLVAGVVFGLAMLVLLDREKGWRGREREERFTIFCDVVVYTGLPLHSLFFSSKMSIYSYV